MALVPSWRPKPATVCEFSENDGVITFDNKKCVPYKGTFFGVDCEITEDGTMKLGKKGATQVLDKEEWMKTHDSRKADDLCDGFGFSPRLPVQDYSALNVWVDKGSSWGLVTQTGNGVKQVVTEGDIIVKGDASSLFAAPSYDADSGIYKNGAFHYVKSMDLSHMDMSHCTNVDNMFYECRGLSSLNLDGWSRLNAGKINNMFVNCVNLSRVEPSFDNGSGLQNEVEKAIAFSVKKESDKQERIARFCECANELQKCESLDEQWSPEDDVDKWKQNRERIIEIKDSLKAQKQAFDWAYLEDIENYLPGDDGLNDIEVENEDSVAFE